MIPTMSRMDMLRQSALQMKLSTMQGPVNADPYGGIQMSNQPVQSMLKPKYQSNMMGNTSRGSLYGSMVRGYRGGLA